MELSSAEFAGPLPAGRPNQNRNRNRNRNHNQQQQQARLLQTTGSGLARRRRRRRKRPAANLESPQTGQLDNKPSRCSPSLAAATRKLLGRGLLAALVAGASAGSGGGESSNYDEPFQMNADEELLFRRLPAGPTNNQQLGISAQAARTPAIDLNQNKQQTDKLSTLHNQPTAGFASPTSQQINNNQQSFADWWSEYWSRQPFPSGYTTSSITILACFITTIIFLIVVGNLLVCIAIFTEKSLKPTQNWFIASLAVSDMLLGLVVMPFSLARELMGFWMFGPLWCDIHEAMDVLLSTASINTLCLISLDRYWSITQAVKYLKKRTPRRGALMIAFVWFFSAAVSLPPLFGWKKPSPVITVSLTNASGTGSGSGDELRAATSTQATTTPDLWIDLSEPSSGSDKRRRRSPELAIPFPTQQITHRNLNDPSRLASPTSGSKLNELNSKFRLRRTLLGRDEIALQPEPEQQQVAPNSNAHQAPNSLSAGWSPENAYQTGPNTAEYPSCQLSDDVGYVVYSALGSFFIPCAVMVFTYIKIFKAARSRARRAISKHQTRASLGSSKARAAAKGAAGGQPNNKPLPVCARDLEANALEPAEHAPMTTKGKLVIVDRRKSLAASPAPAADNIKQQPVEGCSEQQKCAPPAPNEASGSGSFVSQCNSAASSVPTIKRRATGSGEPETSEEERRKAAALLKAISQVGSLQAAAGEHDDAWAELLVSSADEEAAAATNTGRANSCHASAAAEPEEKGEEADELLRLELPGSGLNTTNETCFMTIEEDSDMFDEQTGRTIMLIAGNASKKHSLPSRQSQGIVMTMLPGKPEATGGGGEQSAEQSPASGVCNSRSCRVARAAQNPTRSASSYCGSSMTINDEEEEEEEEDEDDEEVECGVDDELLTDDCNGYSVSCALDQYCSNADNTCSHCQECAERSAGNQPARPLSRHLSMTDSPLRSGTAKATGRARQQQQQESEPQSMTADDNLSLTEYRSNEEDDSSSIMGHGVLDATTPQHKPAGEKKKSLANITSGLIAYSSAPADAKRKSIGFRLARLGSSAPAPAGNLLALASSQQQQQQQNQNQQQQQAAGAGRNLKALRQNFFLKLNQLTAKSTAGGAGKQPEAVGAAKKSSKWSPTGKSSAPSSGTSYEQSVDCATTSNLHSEYPHDEITAYEESEVQTSAKLQSTTTTSGSHERQPELNQQEGQANRKGLAESEAGRANHDDKALLLVNRRDAGSAAKQPGAGGRASLLLQQQQQRDLEHEPAIANKDQPGNCGQTVAMIESSGNRQPNNGSAGNGKAPALSGTTGATGSTGNQTNKAYLASDNERHKRKLAKARERRAILILGIIMAAFICSWLPFFTFYVIRALCNICRDYVPPRLEAFIFWAGYCNSAINPIIYTIFNRDFRKAFRKLLLCKR